VYCGSYSVEANAKERATLLNQNGFDTNIITV